MDPLAIAALVEQLATLAFQVYQQVQHAQLAASGTTTLKPIVDLLADADAKFAAIQAASVDEPSQPDPNPVAPIV